MNRFLILFITLIFSKEILAIKNQIITRQETLNTSKFPQQEDFATKHKLRGLDSFYDPRIDYSKFSGRLTDKDRTATILKINVESKNAIFFKASDPLKFWVAKKRDDTKPCVANIRAIEKDYITIFVKNLQPCWGESYNFRRGTILIFESERLAQRIKDISRYRVTLIAKKRDFIEQLNEVNKFVWGFRQEQVDVAAKYDRQILEIRKKKEMALNQLMAKKKDQVRIQRELSYRLDQIDKDLKFYRIEKDELYTDRWHLDHDSGLPVYKKPQAMKDL